MPKYNYIAKTLEGEQKKGLSEAKDVHQLARILRQQGAVLIKADLEGEASKKKNKIFAPFSFLSRVSLKDKIMFCRNLQVMIASGVSLPRALTILSEQSRKKKFQKILLKIKEEITKGRSFSETLADFPAVFSDLFINMLKVGEETGNLEEVLRISEKQMEKENQLKSKVKGAMVYPSVILITMIIIGILMLILVVPKLAQIFKDLKTELPFTTKIVIALGLFLGKYWYLLPLVIVFFFLFARYCLKTKSGKKLSSALFLKIPIIAPLVKKSNAAHISRTLSSLIKAGVPIVRSLEVVAGSLENFYYKKAISGAAEKVVKGSRLADALTEYQDIFPDLVVQMTSVGEETGETSSILEKLAEFFEEEVANATQNLSAVVEPVLMVIIGAVVGFFAISMIQPIYSMMGAL